MTNDYLDDEDMTTKEDYLTDEEKLDATVNESIIDEDDELVGDVGLPGEPDPHTAEESENIRTGKFDDEEPDVDDVADDKHPYPHP